MAAPEHDARATAPPPRSRLRRLLRRPPPGAWRLRRWIAPALLAAAAPGLPAAGAAADPATGLHTELRREGERYHVLAEATIDGSAAHVRALLTDYENLARVHGSVQRAEPLGTTPAGAERVRIESLHCVLVFCFDVVQVTDFIVEGNGDLVAVIVPEGSDFRHGRFHWRLAELPGPRVAMRFSGEVEPAFWLPPVIGPWLLGRELESLAGSVARNLARHAGVAP